MSGRRSSCPRSGTTSSAPLQAPASRSLRRRTSPGSTDRRARSPIATSSRCSLPRARPTTSAAWTAPTLPRGRRAVAPAMAPRPCPTCRQVCTPSMSGRRSSCPRSANYEFGPAASTSFTIVPDRAIEVLWSPTTSRSTASFGFRAASTDYYQCRLDSSDAAQWTSCSGNTDGYDTETGLADGAHTLDVRAQEFVTSIGNYEFGPSTRITWNVTHRHGQHRWHLPSRSNPPTSDPVPWVSYSYSAPGAASYQCTWDGGAPTSLRRPFRTRRAHRGLAHPLGAGGGCRTARWGRWSLAP